MGASNDEDGTAQGLDGVILTPGKIEVDPGEVGAERIAGRTIRVSTAIRRNAIPKPSDAGAQTAHSIDQILAENGLRIGHQPGAGTARGAGRTIDEDLTTPGVEKVSATQGRREGDMIAAVGWIEIHPEGDLGHGEGTRKNQHEGTIRGIYSNRSSRKCPLPRPALQAYHRSL